jgi:hypothetical protein
VKEYLGNQGHPHVPVMAVLSRGRTHSLIMPGITDRPVCEPGGAAAFALLEIWDTPLIDNELSRPFQLLPGNDGVFAVTLQDL